MLREQYKDSSLPPKLHLSQQHMSLVLMRMTEGRTNLLGADQTTKLCSFPAVLLGKRMPGQHSCCFAPTLEGYLDEEFLVLFSWLYHLSLELTHLQNSCGQLLLLSVETGPATDFLFLLNNNNKKPNVSHTCYRWIAAIQTHPNMTYNTKIAEYTFGTQYVNNSSRAHE